MLTTRCSTLVAACAIAAPACCALADELHVPSQYPTIAAAVAASQAGDEIILADGEYTGDGNHDIAMPSHALTIRSASGNPEACVIQMRDVYFFPPERAFTFTSVSSDTVVRGITITGGSGRGRGGGVLITGGAPRFEDCSFRGNWAWGPECGGPTYGGAVHMSSSSAVFDRCAFIGNIVAPDPCSGTGHGDGGGVYISGGAPTFIDCHFRGNSAYGDFLSPGYAGAMYVSGANVLLQRTRFERNSVYGYDGDGYGGAIVTSGRVTAIECEFVDNRAGAAYLAGGGAIAMLGGTLSLVNSQLTGNEAAGDFWGALGGAIYASGGEAFITNCVIAESEAATYEPTCEPSDRIGAFGAALCLRGTASVVVRSSTLAGNSSSGSCGGDVAYLFGAQTLDVANSIIWGSGADPIATFEPGAVIEIAFSDVEGGWPGEGNIDADPAFADPAGGDYRLSAGSPAADAGANDLVPPDTFDLDGDGDTAEPLPLDLAFAPRFTDDPAAPDTGRGAAPIVDMGAYETVVDGCYADCDGSGELDFFDFLCFQNAFAAGEPYADCDGSGKLDFFDFLCFQNAFAAGCE